MRAIPAVRIALVSEKSLSTVFWPYCKESVGSSALSQMSTKSWFAKISDAMFCTLWASSSWTSIDAGRGLSPSSWSTISGLEVDLRKLSRAWSFVVKETLSTPSYPSIVFITFSMSASLASSFTYAVMETWFSTDATTLLTTAPAMQKMPMISNERKIVMIDPSVVERLRVKPVSDSRKK